MTELTDRIAADIEESKRTGMVWLIAPDGSKELIPLNAVPPDGRPAYILMEKKANLPPNWQRTLVVVAFVLVCFAFGLATCARAKTSATHIHIAACDGIKDYHECAIISIVGDIVDADGQQFISRTNDIDKAVVVLSSQGGSMMAGIAIGEHIHTKGWSTLIPANAKCLSACANIWIAGKTRGMEPKSLLLWHVAFRDDDPANADGMGNVLMGVYLAHLGFSYEDALRLFGHDPLDVHTTYSDENGTQARKTLRWNGTEFAEKKAPQ